MEFPSKCPYCGKDIIRNCKYMTGDHENSIGIHKCIHCSKPIFIIEQSVMNNGTKSWQTTHHYPTVTTVDFPARIKELSPTTYKTFEQTIKAKEQGFDMLVGAGLRIALEWLVWDYLIKVKGLKETDITNLKLYERINMMSENFYTDVCARLVRLFGNDSVHIVKQLDFSVDEVTEMFQLLCNLIDSELQIKEVNSRLPPKH